MRLLLRSFKATWAAQVMDGHDPCVGGGSKGTNKMNLAKMMVIGVMLAAAGIARASGTEAEARTTLNVKLALLDKLGADSLHVDVETNGTNVVLKGTVNRRETMELAETIAKSVSGVHGIDNDIRVQATQDNPSRAGASLGEADAEVKDGILSSKVRLALIDKMGTDGFRIGSDVANGVVTLQFDRDLTPWRRQEAMEAVKAVSGVSRVMSVDKK